MQTTSHYHASPVILPKPLHDEEEALFPSAQAALRFAFHHGAPRDRPTVDRIAAPSTGISNGLGGLEGAAQGAMIRAEIRDSGALNETAIIARYAVRGVSCSCRRSCCSGNMPNAEWSKAMIMLADNIRSTALNGTSGSYTLRVEYVARYFAAKGEKRTLDAIARDHGIHEQTASAHAGKVAKYLRELEFKAYAAVEQRLLDKRMIAA